MSQVPPITETGLRTRLARRLAMQVLFVWDAAGKPDETEAAHVVADAMRGVDQSEAAAVLDAQEAQRRALEAARRAWEQWDYLNQTLERLAPQWPVRRMPGVDRAILRLGTWELMNTPTPPKVVIDEAIELAREFSTADSPRFVNAVLDAVLKEREGMGARSQEPEARSQGAEGGSQGGLGDTGESRERPGSPE